MSSDGCSWWLDSPQPGCCAPALFLTQSLPGLSVLHRGSHLQQHIYSQRAILAENVHFLSNRSDVCCMGGRRQAWMDWFLLHKRPLLVSYEGKLLQWKKLLTLFSNDFYRWHCFSPVIFSVTAAHLPACLRATLPPNLPSTTAGRFLTPLLMHLLCFTLGTISTLFSCWLLTAWVSTSCTLRFNVFFDCADNLKISLTSLPFSVLPLSLVFVQYF